ncbi:MAG TPA: phosphatase PAP2 family protein [Ktedonobacteraceae bacterium]|nr:phosphatase PAP2 family protein [Ktedonobacteraceae bacterium]
MFSALLQLNYTLFKDINAPAGSHPLFDALMIFCANYLIFFWPLLLLLVWGIPLSWRKRALRPGEGELLQERRAVVLWVVLACLIAYAFNLLLEQFIFEPRPFVTHSVHLLVTHPADASFPSDHAAWSFAVVGMLLFALIAPTFAIRRASSAGGAQSASPPVITPVLLLIAAFVIACTICVARVYVGVHYPGDIVGGAINGLVAAMIVTLLRRWQRKPTDAVLRFAHRLRLA